MTAPTSPCSACTLALCPGGTTSDPGATHDPPTPAQVVAGAGECHDAHVTAIKGDLDSWAVEPRGERRVLRVDPASAIGTVS